LSEQIACWIATETTMANLFAAHGRPLTGPEQQTADFGSFTFVIAKRVESH
jgi:hypothetical protein